MQFYIFTKSKRRKSFYILGGACIRSSHCPCEYKGLLYTNNTVIKIDYYIW